MMDRAVAGDGPVGFVGLGRMGRPMARNLLGAGFDVIAFDADPAAVDRCRADGIALAKATELAGAAAARVILMLPDSDVVEKVASELAGALPIGATVVDMSSSDPWRTRRLAADLAERGIRLVDAPVSGGVSAAETGTLTIMVGGDRGDVDGLGPVFAALGASIVHAGPTGAGHAVKALNNAMSAAHLLATCEAMSTASAFGLDLATVLEIVNRSSGRSASSEAKWPRFIGGGTFDSGFALALMAKDVAIAAGLAEQLDVRAGLLRSVADRWADAEAALPEGSDHTEIARWVDG